MGIYCISCAFSSFDKCTLFVLLLCMLTQARTAVGIKQNVGSQALCSFTYLLGLLLRTRWMQTVFTKISASFEELPKMQGPILILQYLQYLPNLLRIYMSLLLVVTTCDHRVGLDPWQWTKRFTSFTSFTFLVECSAEFCPLALRHPGEAWEVLGCLASWEALTFMAGRFPFSKSDRF